MNVLFGVTYENNDLTVLHQPGFFNNALDNMTEESSTHVSRV